MRTAFDEDQTYPTSVPLSLPRFVELSPHIVDCPDAIEKDTFLIQFLMDLVVEVSSSSREHVYT